MFDKWCGIAAGILSGGYTLIEIQDEPVPLGSSPEAGDRYFGTVIGVMILLVLICVVTIYIFSCCRCRERIRYLKQERDVYCGWNLRRLRETIEELELEETEQIVNDMQEIFSKRVPEAEPFCE